MNKDTQNYLVSRHPESWYIGLAEALGHPGFVTLAEVRRAEARETFAETVATFHQELAEAETPVTLVDQALNQARRAGYGEFWDEGQQREDNPPHCRTHLQFRSDCPQCVSEREFS